MDIRQVVQRDAIPSIDDPEFGQSYDGDPDDELIVVPDDPPRAYPIRYLHYHEIVNDTTADGEPIAVTCCPLCGSAVVYDRDVDGQTLTFGVSGKLADDDLVMYDHETEGEWKQSLGEAIDWSLAGETLSARPMRVTTWREFSEDNPDGIVLRPPGGTSEAAGNGSERAPIDYDARPYEKYFERDGFGLAAHRRKGTRKWDRDDLDPKEVVLGVELDDAAVGFPRSRVVAAGHVVTETLGATDIVVFAPDFTAFENPGHEFEYLGGRRFRADGTTWDGLTGEATNGRQLDPVPTRRLFAFAWQDDHGPQAFFERQP